MLVNELLSEDRKKDLVYTDKVIKDKIERVTVELDGKASGKMTRIAKRYKQLSRLISSLQEKQEALNAAIRVDLLDYFDEKDKVYTRVVETLSLTATLSKEGLPGVKTDHEAVVSQLVDGILELQPQLEEQVKTLLLVATAAASKPTKGAAPKLLVKVNEGMVFDSIKAFVKYVSTALSNLRKSGKQYDAQLAKLKLLVPSKKLKRA